MAESSEHRPISIWLRLIIREQIREVVLGLFVKVPASRSQRDKKGSDRIIKDLETSLLQTVTLPQDNFGENDVRQSCEDLYKRSIHHKLLLKFEFVKPKV